ncbi:MAG TPA: PAS domain S-box protein [Syntrophales bacterium]|jgi:PAS domain S-box-containing protein|nr:PAS domain S-box protein [Syntrophales bacterium]HOU77177.1 PAS domain S-box protein [Syntrophales bacterium]HPC32058.1 PAS domain S-box protein [Syntrophales bacterium]HQG33805.1 PAS domain S-box protein [Syntrophales bacterium]HQI35187.1 PAS domain S-box protein [Syntrophales bacterium]
MSIGGVTAGAGAGVDAGVFQAVFHAAPVPMAITRLRDGVLMDVNRAWLEATGLAREESLGRTTGELNIFLNRSDRERLFRELTEKGKVDGFEFEMRHRSGSTAVMFLTLKSYMWGGETYVFGICQDISAQKLAEESLRNRESYLSSIIENQPGLVWLKDRQGKYLAVNEIYAQACGVGAAKDLVGRTDAAIWPAELAEKYRRDDLRVMETGKPLIVEEQVLIRGEMTWVETFKTPVYDGQGNVIGTTGYARDVTERKKVEKELERYRESLEQAVEERTRELEYRTKTLEEMNIALKVLLDRRAEEKSEMEDRFVMNIRNLVMPFTEKLKETHLDERQLAYLQLIENNLAEVTSTMIKKMHQFKLTPTELEVASLIKNGKTTKKIADIMGIAPSSVNTHRHSIRKKMGINKKNVNLCSSLRALD